MPTLELPALDGHDPLGFLAALGLQCLLTDELPDPVRLSFSPLTGRALLDSPLPDVEAITDVLAGIVARASDGTAIIGVHDDFPFRPANAADVKAGRADNQKDPIRTPRHLYPALVERTRRCDPRALPWLRAVVTDLAVDKEGRVALTPFCAPSGKQSVRTYFTKPLEEVRRHPAHLHHALTRWRRTDNFTGEYLDHRVINDAAHHPQGQSTERGVPGATWLATQTLPLFTLTGDGHRTLSTLWHHHNNRYLMIWPLWTHPLTLTPTQTLLNHPHITPTTNAPSLHNLTVFTLAAAERKPLRKSLGPLTPTPWPPPPLRNPKPPQNP